MSKPVLVAVCAVSLALLAGGAAAQSVWDGEGDGVSWSDPANWAPDGVPDSTTDVSLASGESVVLDVAAAVRDLELDGGSVLSGPGDLTVAGGLSWGTATIEGGGAFTANGGIDLLAHGTKVLGRSLDAFCDVTWDHSDLFFDTSVGATFHHHAGFTFDIVGSHRGGRASHRDAPAIGVDPEADNTDAYAFIFDGTTQVGTTVTHEMSVQVNGTYAQTGGTTYFRAGSGIEPTALVEAYTGTSLRFGRGTHQLEGVVKDATGETSEGLFALGDQTALALLGAEYPLAVDLRGAVSVGRSMSLPRLTITGETSIFGTGSEILDLGEVELLVQSSLESLAFQDIVAFADSVRWTEGNVRLENGASLTAAALEVSHTSTGLQITDDGTGPSESLTVTDLLRVNQTASVPPRIDTNFGFPNGARAELEGGRGLWLEGTSSIGGRFELADSSEVRLVRGEHTIASSARLGGPGALFVDVDATLRLEQTEALAVDTRVSGTVALTGANTASAPITLDGGTIEGPGSLAAPVVVDPASPATFARFDGANVALTTGSRLGNGSLQLQNGAEATVPLDAVLVVDQTAFGLVISDDGNGAQIESFRVEGTVDVARTGSPAHRYQLPVEITPTGLVLVQPDARARFERGGDIFGTLHVRENGEAAFQFAQALLRSGGIVRGDGTIRKLLNGGLDLGGTISPGESDGDIGTLTLDGTWPYTSATTYRVDVSGDSSDRVDVTQATAAAGSLEVVFVEPQDGESEVIVILTSTSASGAFDDVTSSGSDATSVAAVTNSTTVELQLQTDLDTAVFAGNVYEDRNQNGAYDPGIDLPVPGATVALETLVGGPVGTQESGENGEFLFTGVGPGIFSLHAQLPSGWTFETGGGDSPTFDVIPPTRIEYDFHARRVADVVAVTSNTDGGPGSLRVVMDQANASPAEVVELDFTAVQGETISPVSELPELTKTVVLRLPAASGRAAPGVVLDGTQCVDCDGLTLGGVDSWVSGLVVQNFEGYGIVAGGEGRHVLAGNTLTGNGAGGLLVAGGNGQIVGDGELALGNTIEGNGGAGIAVTAGTGHRLRGNSIFANAGPAIDLGDDGVTPNDPLDPDSGPNGRQNAPLLTGSAFVGGVTVSGSLDSRAFTTYVIDVYGSDACPSGGSGDGQRWLGAGLATTDAIGHAEFALPVAFWAGELTATATAPDGSTSEVSDCLATEVVDAPLPSPERFGHFAFPNPALGPTTLSFALPASERVEANVYDVTGRLVRTLHAGRLGAGDYRLVWDGREREGRPVGAGVYFYRLRVGDEEHHGKITRLR